VLDDMFAMVQAMKVPGRKAKGKFQILIAYTFLYVLIVYE